MLVLVDMIIIGHFNMIEQEDRDRLNGFIDRIEEDVISLASVENTHRKAVLLDQYSSLKNDIIMILKRCDEGMTIDEAAEGCKFFEKIIINN